MNKIPVRGAISFGDLYSQKERNVFIGPALVDAYHYGEGQNMLGFLLAPSAVKALETIGLPANERLHYRKVVNTSMLKHRLEGPVYAFAFNSGSINNRNLFLAPLIAMQQQAGIAEAQKYENTLMVLQSA